LTSKKRSIDHWHRVTGKAEVDGRLGEERRRSQAF
jgi:hypothetical protein